MKDEKKYNYTIAWFKLAECVTRKERVRAFGVFRLLAHSFDDKAYAHQLKGDLFLAFQDYANAIEKYKEAAAAYQKEGRKFEAAAVYEHLRVLEPKQKHYKDKLINLYKELNISSKIKELQ